MATETRIEIVALAASAGGIEAIAGILRTLRPDFPAAVVTAMHLSPIATGRLNTFRTCSALPVAFIDANTTIEPRRVYVAPPAHAIELEPDGTATITPLASSKYSIDATLRSIAESHGPSALVVVLTGMRNDGAQGARAIKERGGYVLVQSPGTALHPNMPAAAIATGAADLILSLADIGPMLDTIVTQGALPPTRQRVAAIDTVFGGPPSSVPPFAGCSAPPFRSRCSGETTSSSSTTTRPFPSSQDGIRAPRGRRTRKDGRRSSKRCGRPSMPSAPRAHHSASSTRS